MNTIVHHATTDPVPGIHVRGTARIGGKVLFGPVDLEISAGQWTCLLGPSGIGKSTILRLIANLSTGASFEGQITASDSADLSGRFAYMAQSDLLLPWLDVRQNVLLGHRLRGENWATERADALIASVGLTEHVSKRPAQLSGGMRQRAALARTLIEDRPIILLDEPFSSLDARTRAEMQELAADALSGRTVFLVTHDPAEAARLAHRIIVLTEQGLTHVQAPETPPIRAHDDAQAFACQNRLMAIIRSQA